jgi:hypothetical protein
MRRLRHGSTDGIAHRVMVVQRRWLGSRGPREISLSLHRVRSPVAVYSSHGSASYTCPRLVRGVIEQSPDVVYEKRVKLFSDLLFVCEFECTLKRNPADCQFCRERAEISTYQTPFRCIGPILTTCRVFSLFRMPSRRPRVMPATLSSFVPLIMWLSVKLVSMHGQQGKQNAYLHDVRHKLPSPRPESTDCLRLPTMWQ